MKKIGYWWTASDCGEIQKICKICKLWLDVESIVLVENIYSSNDRISDDNASLNTKQFLDMFKKRPGTSTDDNIKLNVLELRVK